MDYWRLAGTAGRAAAVTALVALSLLASQDAAKPAQPLSVTAVRCWSLDDATRVVIEVSGEFQFRRDWLRNPDRLYFDIVGAKPTLSKELIYTIPVGDAFVRQIRVSEVQQNVTRVVLDMARPAEFSAAQLANPDRLVIELKQPGKPLSESSKPPSAAPQVEASKPAAVAVPAPPANPADDRVALPARAPRTGSNSLVRALGLKLGRVVLDPGHGGHDTGTIGPSGLLEKDVVLDVALRLGALIEQRMGADVIYTRRDNSFVPLEQRTALANEKQADLFLSIHANAGASTVSGSETYYLNFSSSKADLDVATRENATSERSIHELQTMIEKIALKDKADESREFASRMQTALYTDMLKANSQIQDRGVRKAPFVVLIGAAMPSVLAEIDFLSNPREEKLLRREDYRQRIAEALYKGLSQYASTLSRFQPVASRTAR
jgi:N-acetylmuramoyl-L-alanine amidase